MSAKFIHTLSDENPDLHKQIGCMNGIFQLFERNHFLSGRRQITGQNHKKHPSGQNANYNIEEPKSATQKTAGKSHKKAVKEGQRISTESSRTSFSSSSCSSSLSSFDCNNRASHLEPCLFNQTAVTESHSMHQLNASFRSSQQSPDLRDVVKDSIYREARGLSVKTATKGESGGQTLKYFDSPRPVLQPNSPKPKSSGLKESVQVLHQLQEAPWKSSEGRHASLPSLKDARRFSCDGRESRDVSKSTTKLKELPRLSLDSRAGSIRRSTTEMKSNYLLADLKRRDGNSNNFLNQQEEPESRIRLSNVVAKLMGLEALPDSLSVNENQTRHIKTQQGTVDNHHFLRSPRTTEENKQNQIPGSPKNLQKEPISPRLKNVDSVKKPIPNSKFPLETAPWRQPDGSRNSQISALKSRTTQPKAPNTSLSVIGEVEKRLAQIDFRQSGKDLRALKQILEAMQKTKEILEAKNEVPKSGTQTSSNSSLYNNSKSSCNSQSNSPISALTKGSSSNSFKSPIVIMKPAKLVRKASNPASLINPTESFTVLHGLPTADSADNIKETTEKQIAKDPIPRTNQLRELSSLPSRPVDKKTTVRLERLLQASKEPHLTTRESTNSGRSSGTLGRRQPQKKIGSEKQTRPTTPSDSTMTRRQSTGQPTKSGFPCRKPRSSTSNLQPSDDELSDVGSDARDFSHHGDARSLQSESTISFASQVDDEVLSTDRSYKINHQKQKRAVARSMKDGSVAESAVASEQPSPVSVLDATFYSDDLPSPIKKKSIAFREDGVEWNHQSSSSTDSSLNPAINHKKLENIHLQIQKLIQKLSTHEEPFISEITNVYNSTNPVHQYILEILLASGLLKDFESGIATNHLHQTGYPINSNLFLALEQARASTIYLNDKENRRKPSKPEHQIKLHRKLVFDVVNEILIHKLLLESSPKHGLSPSLLADKGPREQQLLGELCSEVDRLQGNTVNCSLEDEEDSLIRVLWADLTHQSKDWTACSSEIPGLVLDIERLIFKDLVTEAVTSNALGLQVQSAGHCRQLYSKLYFS